jgi:hypothetical protein
LVLILLLVGSVAVYDGLTFKANNLKEAEQRIAYLKNQE